MDSHELMQRRTMEDVLHSSSNTPPRRSHDPQRARNQPSPRVKTGKPTPLRLPSTLNSMLKNTTETGDIGLFSIKPARFPNPGLGAGSPRRSPNKYNGYRPPPMSQDFRLRPTPPRIDDRHRLPSYSRGRNSDATSLYENRSMSTRSDLFSRDSTAPDHRSYSMTQASQPYHSLSNNRSYTSLRSQIDQNLIPRPRSPFPYPARLKRPGFRASSPVLGNGGSIDYSRRTEIERPPQASRLNSSSPASFYSQRRAPTALSVCSTANRSTTSLNGGSLSTHVTQVHRRFADSGQSQDWWNSRDIILGSTSPAPSLVSTTSTRIVYPHGSTPLAARLHSSPLYYDYTEEFESNGHPPAREPDFDTPTPTPMHYPVHRTIPEDREISSEWSQLDIHTENVCPPRSTGQDPRTSGIDTNSSSIKDFDTAAKPQQDVHIQISEMCAEHGGSDKIVVEEMHRTGSVSAFERGRTRHILKKITNVDGAYSEEHPQSSSSIQNSDEFTAFEASDDVADIEAQSKRSSYFSLGSFLPAFPNPPDHLVQIRTNTIKPARSQRGFIDKTSEQQPAEQEANGRKPVLAESDNELRQNNMTPKASSNRTPDAFQSPSLSIAARQDQVRAGRIFSLDHGDWNSDRTNTQSCNEEQSNHAILKPTPSMTESLRRLENKPALATSSTDFAKSNIVVDSPPPHRNRTNQTGTGAFKPGVTDGAHTTINSNRQYRIDQVLRSDDELPKKFATRSESPMLAPKAISPARELKLKNHVPHLMKALPALPATQFREAIQAVTPDARVIAQDLPSGFSPLIPDGLTGSTVNTSTRPTQEPVELDSVPVLLIGSKELASWKSKHPSISHSARFKLKPRSNTALRSLSPSDTPRARPWNLDASYPWEDASPGVTLPQVDSTQNSETNAAPKFKLKLTRASTSELGGGTVRIRKSTDINEQFDSSGIPASKDLFSSPATSALSSLFQQVNNKFNSRKSSLASGVSIPEEIRGPLIRVIPPTQSNYYRDGSLNPDSAQSPPGTGLPRSPTDIRSFFSDDSSFQGQNSLKKRISNFRARLPVPYSSRSFPMAQSCDDIVYRTSSAQRPGATSPSTHAGVHTRDDTPQTGPMRTYRRRKLKSKISGWIREARTVVGGWRKRNRDSDEVNLVLRT